MNLDKVQQLTVTVHFVSHTGDDNMEDCNKVAEDVGGMSDSGRFKGIGKALS